MTRKEAETWVASLKPGDTVIHKIHDNIYIRKVQKVTPSGIVRTDGGSFRISKWCNYVSGTGDICGDIFPCTDDLLAEAQRQQKYREDEMDKKRTIQKAMIKSREICVNTPYDFAVDFLNLCDKYGI